MKLVPTNEKVKINWIVWNNGKKSIRNNEIKFGQGYDFHCSCGFESNYGGGTLKTITTEIWNHKFYEHDYKLIGEYK